MRRGTIQINNYFAKLATDRTDLLPPPHSSKIFRVLASVKVKGLPVHDATNELMAAWQLGIATTARQDGDKLAMWTIDGQRLSDLSGEGLPQAGEQLAAALAVAHEGLESSSYMMSVLGPAEAVQYVNVFSTTYNALLARELGVPRVLLAHGQPRLPIDTSMNEAMQARVQEANELVESHGLRRMYKLQHEGAEMTRGATKESQTQMMQPALVDQLTVWRHVQEGDSYKLAWYVELTDGAPAHVACSVERGNEAQCAVIETYALLANRQLKQAGTRGVARLGMGAQSGYFDGDSPIDEFTTVFTTTFLTLAEQVKIGLKNSELTTQTDLLQSIEAVVCGRCSNLIQQFGSYGICLHCGDAQKVKN
jgi:hypothetical protein